MGSGSRKGQCSPLGMISLNPTATWNMGNMMCKAIHWLGQRMSSFQYNSTRYCCKTNNFTIFHGTLSYVFAPYSTLLITNI